MEGTNNTEQGEITQEELERKIFDKVGDMSTVKFNPNIGDFGGYEGAILELAEDLDASLDYKNQTSPNKVPFLPEKLTLRHATTSKDTYDTILKEGLKPMKYGDTPIKGIYYSSQDWGENSRFRGKTEYTVYSDIRNEGLIYFNSGNLS